MNGFEKLLELTGQWEGRNRVQPEIDGRFCESQSRLTVTPMLDRSFVRFDQTWLWESDPQSGSMLIGYEPESDLASVHWIDTWHNGRKVMRLAGRFDAQDRLIANGHFAVKSGPDWRWRMEIGTIEDRLNIEMFCINPQNGRDEGWVRANFVRAAEPGAR
jgi:hypothetical protein